MLCGDVYSGSLVSMRGTPGYMAPESSNLCAVQPGYLDMWAVGILVYELITGDQPFRGGTYVQRYKQALEGPCVESRYEFHSMPQEMLGFMKRCLNIIPYKRPTAEEGYDIVSELLKHADIPREPD